MKNKVLLLVVFIGLIFAGCGQKTLDLNDYLKVEVSGYNGSGYASCDVDFKNLVKDYAEAAGIKEDSDEYYAMEANLEMYIEAECDSDSLSNGDKYTVKWTVPESIAEKKKVVLLHEPKVFTVSGLGQEPVFVKSADDINTQDISDIRVVTDETAKEYLQYLKLVADLKAVNGVDGIVDVHENEKPEYAFAIAKKDFYGGLILVLYYKYTITFTDDSYTYGDPVGEHWEGFHSVTDWEEVSPEYYLYLPIEFNYIKRDSNGKIVASEGSAKIKEHAYSEDTYYCWEKGTDPNDNYYCGGTPGYFMYEFDIYRSTVDDIKAKLLQEEGCKLIE